jgi:hypothetical protein
VVECFENEGAIDSKVDKPRNTKEPFREKNGR